VYADWLEEHGDARGELIRVEEEMRSVPVFSDRFWQLKPRRNALRSASPIRWLESMCYGTECEPVFRHPPKDWKEWWRLVREFTERWRRISLADVGGRQDELQATSAQLGRELPPSMCEWVAFAHDVRTSSDYHNVLRDVYQMEELQGHSAISLLLQCEGDYHWAVRHTDLTIPDPPVYGFHWDFEAPDPENTFVLDASNPNPVAEALSQFALSYSLSYAHGTGGGFGTDVDDSEELLRQLEEAFPVHFVLREMEIFEKNNMLVRLNHWRDREYISVEVFKPLPRAELPPFLLEYTQHGGYFHGMFAPDDSPHGATTFRGRTT
jgi:hypothetical protein